MPTSTQEVVPVIDTEGRHGHIEANQLEGSSENQVLISHGEGRLILVDADLLELQPDETYRLQAAFAEFVTLSAEQERMVIPIVEETLAIRKRSVVKDRIRLVKTVDEEIEEIQTSLREENVHVERVPINRIVEEPVATRTEGETLIVPLHREVLVVHKQYVLTEEVHITKTHKVSQETRTVPLRSEHLAVERTGPPAPSEPGD